MIAENVLIDMVHSYYKCGEHCEPSSRLPDELISFNPSDKNSVDELLSKYGPEGLWEISTLLRNICLDDISGAIDDVEKELLKNNWKKNNLK